MNSTRVGLLPPEAEQFLGRLPSLSRDAWLDISSRNREPITVTIRHLLRGLLLSILPRRARVRFDAAYSRTAAERLKRLATSGEIPMHRLSWRAYHAADSALQALCNRGNLEEEAVREMYAPFEKYIPFRSLAASGAGSSSSGAAGA